MLVLYSLKGKVTNVNKRDQMKLPVRHIPSGEQTCRHGRQIGELLANHSKRYKFKKTSNFFYIKFWLLFCIGN